VNWNFHSDIAVYHVDYTFTHSFELGYVPSSLYTFNYSPKKIKAWLGIATAFARGFTEFDTLSVADYSTTSPIEPLEVLLLHPAVWYTISYIDADSKTILQQLHNP
jgi:hypothetical protein